MNTTYKPEYCQMLIDHMKKGLSYQTFGGTIGAGRSTIYDWEKVFPEFKEAKQIALMKAQEFFEQRLIIKISGQDVKGIAKKEIDTACLIFALKTRFHETYGEKQEVTHSVSEIKITKEDAEL